MTEFVKTGKNTEIHFLLGDKTSWPGLLFQKAFFRRCKTTRVHFMACVAPEGH